MGTWSGPLRTGDKELGASEKQSDNCAFLVSVVKDSRTLAHVVQELGTVKATNAMPGILCSHSGWRKENSQSQAGMKDVWAKDITVLLPQWVPSHTMALWQNREGKSPLDKAQTYRLYNRSNRRSGETKTPLTGSVPWGCWLGDVEGNQLSNAAEGLQEAVVLRERPWGGNHRMRWMWRMKGSNGVRGEGGGKVRHYKVI